MFILVFKRDREIQEKLRSQDRTGITALGPRAVRPLCRLAVRHGRASHPAFQHAFLYDVLGEVVRSCSPPAASQVFRALRYGLRHSQGPDRERFIKFLGVLGYPQGIKVLAREARNPRYCAVAIEALGTIKLEESTHVLKPFLGHSDRGVAEKAIRAIANIGLPNAETLISGVRGQDLEAERNRALVHLKRERAMEVVLNIEAQGSAMAVPMLLERLRTTHEDTLRVAILQALARARDPRAVPDLVGLDGYLKIPDTHGWVNFDTLGVWCLKAAMADALVCIADLSLATERDLMLLSKVPDDTRTERKRFGDNEYECNFKDGHSWEEDVTTVFKRYDDLRALAVAELARRLEACQRFPVGTRVRIKPRDFLERFLSDPRYTQPLTQDQIACASVHATVEAVGFHYGADVLYELSNLPGTWHEACLELEQLPT